MTIKPSPIDLLDENGYECIEENTIDRWRWGTVEEWIYQSEDTPPRYWSATFRISTDGETNGLRDGEAVIAEVVPTEVIKTVWTRIKK